MGRKKQVDEVTKLELEIRELKSINRQLLRKLKKLDKQFKDEDLKEETSPIKETIRQQDICPACARGTLKEESLGGLRKFKKCTNVMCDYRTKFEKV